MCKSLAVAYVTTVFTFPPTTLQHSQTRQALWYSNGALVVQKRTDVGIEVDLREDGDHNNYLFRRWNKKEDDKIVDNVIAQKVVDSHYWPLTKTRSEQKIDINNSPFSLV